MRAEASGIAAMTGRFEGSFDFVNGSKGGVDRIERQYDADPRGEREKKCRQQHLCSVGLDGCIGDSRLLDYAEGSLVEALSDCRFTQSGHHGVVHRLGRMPPRAREHCRESRSC